MNRPLVYCKLCPGGPLHSAIETCGTLLRILTPLAERPRAAALAIGKASKAAAHGGTR